MFCVGVSWVYVSLHDFGGMPAALTVFVTFLLAAILALFPALAGWLSTFVRPGFSRTVLMIPAAWTFCEWLRSWVFTGFPWLSLGYSQVPGSPLAGYAPVLGIYGVSFAMMVLAAAIAYPIGQPRARVSAKNLIVLATTLLTLAIGWGLGQVRWTAPSGEPLAVSLLQGNIAQDIKWRTETVVGTLETYERLARASRDKLIVFPETALPLFLNEVPESYLENLAQHARSVGGDMLVGVPETTEPGIYHNTVISLGRSPSQTYRKVHLVPFSEFIPLKWLIGWVYDDLLNMPLADFTAGLASQPLMAVAGHKIAVTNCYEDLFGNELVNRVPQASLLANLSNDAWFGRSLGPQQHLQISQMRALETGRWMLRATNTGVTAIIDERGVVVSRLPEFTQGALEGKVQGYAGSTPYVRWGNYAVVLLAAAMMLTTLVSGKLSGEVK
jgi:apolipoprotein N-acyltransferase